VGLNALILLFDGFVFDIFEYIMFGLVNLVHICVQIRVTGRYFRW